MPADFDLGDNYELNENSNGDLEIVDSNNGQTVLTHDNSTQTWQFGVDTNLANNDLTGVGALDAQSVSTESATISDIGGLSVTPIFDETFEFGSGEQKRVGVTSEIPATAPHIVTAFPADTADGNNLGFSSYLFVRNDGNMRATVTEEEGSGGGSGRVIIWELSV